MDASTRAVCTAVVATLVAVAGYVTQNTLPLTGYAGELPLVVLCSLLAVVVAVGWPVLLDLPSRPGATAVVALVGVGAVLSVAATTGEPYLRELPVVFAVGILLAFVNELLRRDGRVRLVESVSGVVSGTLVVSALAGWVAVGRTPGGEGLVVAGALALAVGSAAVAIPASGWLSAVLTTAVAVGAGAGAGAALPTIDPTSGALLGLAVGVLVAAMHELLDRLPALRRRSAAFAAIVLPVALTGILVYVVGRVLVG